MRVDAHRTRGCNLVKLLFLFPLVLFVCFGKGSVGCDSEVYVLCTLVYAGVVPIILYLLVFFPAFTSFHTSLSSSTTTPPRPRVSYSRKDFKIVAVAQLGRGPSKFGL